MGRLHDKLTNVILDVQFNASTTPWPELRDAVIAAQEAGYGVAWVLDHLAGQVMRGDQMLECFTWVGALAASTTTIGIGTLVANVWNRPVAVLAAAAAFVSGGQFHRHYWITVTFPVAIGAAVLISSVRRQGLQTFILSDHWSSRRVCLLLQDLLQSCSRGGEEESGRHVL